MLGIITWTTTSFPCNDSVSASTVSSCNSSHPCMPMGTMKDTNVPAADNIIANMSNKIANACDQLIQAWAVQAYHTFIL